MQLSAGQVFAGYRIVRLLGSGGMGEVYLAEHPRLPRRDALKVLPGDVSADPDYRARFTREADLASKLWHSNIVSVHDRGEFNGQLWIAMDYIDGLDAARLLGSRYPGGMPVGRAVGVITAVASALDYAHKQGLLHRDVKPANIMLTHLDDDEDEQRVLLADFGIARNVDDTSGLTATNMTVGTVAYSAPEQLMGEELDGRTDQYALAATAFHLLAGSHLFPHSNPAVVISRHLNSSPPALAATRRDLAALDPVLAQALSKDPNDRFARCAEFARALAEHSSAQGSPSPVGVTKPAPVLPTPKGSRAQAIDQPQQALSSASAFRRWWLAAPATLAVILLASGIALAWHPWKKGQSTTMATASSPPPAATSPTSSSAPPLPPPSPAFPSKVIDGVLLGPTEVIGVTGSTGPRITVNKSMSGYSYLKTVKPASCSGVMLGADHSTAANAGLAAMRSKILTRPPGSSGQGPTEVEQSVSVFATVDQTKSVASATESQWESCANNGVVQGSGEDIWTFNFSTVQTAGDMVTVSMAAPQVESGGRACQSAIGVRANVMVEAWTCLWADYAIGTAKGDPSLAGRYAGQLVVAMLDKVKV